MLNFWYVVYGIFKNVFYMIMIYNFSSFWLCIWESKADSTDSTRNPYITKTGA